MEVRVYLTNLAQYNAGRLIGKWLELPLTEDELKQAFKDVLGSDEEYFITDYEAPFRIEEYDNLTELNTFVEQLNELDEYEQVKAVYLMESVGLTRQEAIQQQEDVTFYQDMTLEDVAEELVEEGIFGNLTDTIKGYLDFEKLARDLSIDGYHETNQGVFHYV